MKGEFNMRHASNKARRLLFWWIPFYLLLVAPGFIDTTLGSQSAGEPEMRLRPYDKSELNLKAIPFKIVYETFRETDGKENWELYLINADGSNATNLTRTPDVHEMYAHASPDGTKVCFVVDEGTGRKKIRNVYFMNIDGTGRMKVADNARQPCWSPDGKTIAYLKSEYELYTTQPYGTKGLFFYDLETARHEQHPNRDLYHIFNISWSPDGKWFVGTVAGGMGFDFANIAFEANGTAVSSLARYGVSGCRPDFSSDGGRMAWGQTNHDLYVAEVDLTLSVPRVGDLRGVVKCAENNMVSHTDLSPDGRYIALGYGPRLNYHVGRKAPGWNICVSDLSGKWVQITTDGKHNKEPDWVPIRESGL
jgi:Tol biopolymer transport system component